MSDRLTTLVCIFDQRSPRISACNIHEWIHDSLLLVEEDIQMVHVVGPKRRVFIKFFNEDRMKEILRDTNGTCEYKYDNGEIPQVSVEIAGMGTKRIRIAGLPPEVKEATIKESLFKYGEIVNIRDEMWAAVYRYKVFNGIKIVEIKLKRHMPSHLTIAGNDALISYDGQPPTCYRCNEPGHQQVDCLRRKLLDPPIYERKSTWADIVSNATRDSQQTMPTRQSDNGIRNRPESPFRIVNKSPNTDTRVQAQDMQELSRVLGRQTPDALPQSLIPEHLSMDTRDDYKERRCARPGE